jgi:hypothetical protein
VADGNYKQLFFTSTVLLIETFGFLFKGIVTFMANGRVTAFSFKSNCHNHVMLLLYGIFIENFYSQLQMF